MISLNLHSAKCVLSLLFILLLVSVSHQELPKDECQEYEQNLMGLFEIKNDFSEVGTVATFIRGTKECFGNWFCQNGTINLIKSGQIDAHFYEKMAKIQDNFCEEIEKGTKIEQAVESVQKDLSNVTETLKKDKKMQKNIQKIVEEGLNKDKKIKEKLTNILDQFQFKSFSHLMDYAFQNLLEENAKIYAPPSLKQKRRRKRAVPNDGTSAAPHTGHGDNASQNEVHQNESDAAVDVEAINQNAAAPIVAQNDATIDLGHGVVPTAAGHRRPNQLNEWLKGKPKFFIFLKMFLGLVLFTLLTFSFSCLLCAGDVKCALINTAHSFLFLLRVTCTLAMIVIYICGLLFCSSVISDRCFTIRDGHVHAVGAPPAVQNQQQP